MLCRSRKVNMTTNYIITSVFALFSDLWMLAGLSISCWTVRKDSMHWSGFSNFLLGVYPISLARISSWNISGRKCFSQSTLSLLNWNVSSLHPLPILWNHLVTLSLSLAYFRGSFLSLSGFGMMKKPIFCLPVIWSQLTAWQRGILELITIPMKPWLKLCPMKLSAQRI